MKYIVILISALIMMVGIGGCSNNKDFDPDDYVTSLLSGEYKKGGMWTLTVTVNGEPMENYGYVRFDSKYLTEGDFRFVNVIPGESRKEFKNVSLTSEEIGLRFLIEYFKTNEKVKITGVIAPGEMVVDIKM